MIEVFGLRINEVETQRSLKMSETQLAWPFDYGSKSSDIDCIQESFYAPKSAGNIIPCISTDGIWKTQPKKRLLQNQSMKKCNHKSNCKKVNSKMISLSLLKLSPLLSSHNDFLPNQNTSATSIAEIASTTDDLNRQKCKSSFSAFNQIGDRSDDLILHRTCQLFPTSLKVIKIALSFNPTSVSSRATITRKFSKVPNRRLKKMTRDPCTLPINIAIQNGASADVVKLLIDTGKPAVLLANDGQNQCCSLSIALHQKPMNEAIVDLILCSNPQSACCPDRKMNYPLHLACNSGASKKLIARLYSAYPDGLKMKNISGDTPLDIVQRQSRCSEAVLDFLHKASMKLCWSDDL